MADQKISALTSYTPALDADVLPIVDTANTLTKKITWANVKVSMKTYTDTLYALVGLATASGLTMGTAKMLGRATAGTGALEEIATTGTGNAVLTASPTITTPVLTGLPTGSGVASAATASTLVSRDANANINTNNALEGYTTTATAAGTTTLTVSSTRQQFFTGSTTQTVTLPVTSTLVLGQSYTIVNQSSGVVTVNSSGANAVKVVAASSAVTVTCILTSGTTAASWSATQYVTPAAAGTSFPAASVFTGTAPNATYTDLDLSATVGSANKMVMIKIHQTTGNTGATYYLFQTKGDLVEYSASGGVIGPSVAEMSNANNVDGYALVMTNATGVVQWTGSRASLTVTLTVVAYW